ncbi:MAG TPA: NAD(P)-binding protein [Blastocatellia bacterium]|nr:NAD(P)-binding protein [Blastocatellia bacterium]
MARSSSTHQQFTRREVLAAMLGLPAALSACRSADAPRLPGGEIVGASDGFGHRLRDGLRVEVPQDRWERAKVVIVGGGVAGLAAARRLLKAGFDDFVMLELERAPGGTARSGSSPVTAYPWGAHYLPAPMKENAALIELLNEMGVIEGRTGEGEPVVAEQFLCRDPEERLYYKGRWYEGLYLRAGASPDDLAQFEAFNKEVARWVGWRDARGRRAFTIPIANCSDDAEVTALDRLTMREWMDARGWTSWRLRWLVDYSCRDDYGLTLEQTSAWAGLFYFASRVRKPGGEAEPLMSWPEGNGRLVAHLYQRAQPKMRLGFAAAEIVPNGANGKGGVDVVAVSQDEQAAVGIHAERVIFAAPHFLSRYVIRDWREAPPAHVAEFRYGAWWVANLFLKDRPVENSFALAWDNVMVESKSLGYVVATHQKGLDRGPTVFTYYYPMCDDDDPRESRKRLLGMEWRDFADVALTDLSRPHKDIRALVERLDVMRWGHAMISPRPNFVWSAARRDAARPYRNIHFAHTDLSGVALFEEAFHHGMRAADEVLAAPRG